MPERSEQQEQMSLPDSSSASRQSEAASKESPPGTVSGGPPSPSGQAGSKPKQSKKDQDLPLKFQVASALATNGYYTRVNVGLSATSSRGLADVTDVDVLGMRYDITFAPSTIAVSCKSGEAKSLSPAREIFYLRGVLDYVRAENGVVAFSNKPVLPHVRDLGRRLGVLVLSGNEVESWCNSLTNGMPDYGYFRESSYEEYLKSWARTDNRGLGAYLRTDYWFHFDFRNLQNVLAYLRKNAAGITGEQTWHATIILDAAAHFCLTLFDLCREVSLLGVSAVSETTAAYLFGGAPSFRARRDLYGRVHQLLSSTGVLAPGGPALPPLEPSYTAHLAELAVRLIDRPQAAVLIPRILQDAFWRGLGATGIPPNEDKNTLVAEKLAQDLLDFLKATSGATWVPKI